MDKMYKNRERLTEKYKRNVFDSFLCKSLISLTSLFLPIVQITGKTCINALSIHSESPLTVKFCELVTSPSKYDGKLIRLTAFYWQGRHSKLLYDLNCNKETKYIFPILECDSEKNCKSLRETINKSLEGDILQLSSRSKLIIIGRFRNTPKSGRRYGEVIAGKSGYLFQVEINKIEATFPVSLGTPWHWEIKKTSKKLAK